MSSTHGSLQKKGIKKMKNKIKFKEFMMGLCEIFDKKFSQTLSDVYWNLLKPFNDNECESAFNQIIATCRFFPKPADFLEILGGTKQDKITDAWQEVMNALEHYSPDFPGSKPKLTPEIHTALRSIGGIDALSRMTYDELQWQEKRFKEAYDGIAGKLMICDGIDEDYLLQ